jgi:hypothetical protein
MKIKLIGQLITDPKPVVLAISTSMKVIEQTANEYASAFPEIFLSAEWGNFRSEVSRDKQLAILNLIGILNSPLSNLFNNIIHN